MKHIDEGTIHAWLDGALGESEAREVSEHTASCAQCGALVAEARGFIAGASRILTSLDDVAGVVPKRAPVTFAPLSAGVASTKPAQRFWQASPWVSGIAAALILAIGVKEWRDRPSAKAAFAPVTATMDSLRRLEPFEAKRLDSALRPEERRALRPLPPAVTPATTPTRARAVAEVSGAGSVGGLGAGVKGATDAREVNISADTARMKSELAKKDALADALQPSAKLVPIAPAPSQPTTLPLESNRADRDERALAGCYRLNADLARESNVLGAVAKAAGAREQDADRRRLAPATAAATATTTVRSDAAIAEQFAPNVVRLDTTMSPRGRMVRSPTDGAALGTWQALVGDSIRLMIPVTGVRTISAANRVECPRNP